MFTDVSKYGSITAHLNAISLCGSHLCGAIVSVMAVVIKCSVTQRVRIGQYKTYVNSCLKSITLKIIIDMDM